MEGDQGWCRGGSSNNWDLHAVVRFACGDAAPTSAPPSEDDAFPWPGPLQPLLTDPAIDELCQALLAAPKPEAPQPSSPAIQQPAQTKPRRGGGGPTRSKRKSKKSQANKEVTRVPASSPSADLWAWRKYGQKPIKGSPYPRGYYRCSTDKDCKARKLVERCRADPGTLIVTYTGEHSHPVPLHRNSLAGTTRNKPNQQPTAEEPQQLVQSDSAGGRSPPSPADTKTQQGQGSPSACGGRLSPSTALRSPSVGVEYEDEEDDDTLAVELLLEDTEMAADDDALLFLQPVDEPAPPGVPGSDVIGCDNMMLLPNKQEEPTLAGGNGGAGAFDDAILFPNNQPDEPAGPHPPGSVSVSAGGAQKDVMFFQQKPDELQQRTTVSAGRANGGAGTVINFVDDKFSVSGLSAWEEATTAAASGWEL